MSTGTKSRFAAALLGLCMLLWAGMALAQQPDTAGPAAAPDPTAAGAPAGAPADEEAPPPIEPADVEPDTAADSESEGEEPAAAPAASPPERAEPEPASAAAGVAQPKAVTEAAPPAGGKRGWKERLRAFMEDDAVVVGKQVLLALLLFIAGWLLSKFIAWIVYRVLVRTTVDDKIAAKLGLQEIMAKEKEPSDGLERVTAKVVYYLLMLLVVIAVLQFAGFTEAAAPIKSFVDKITAAMPLVGKAILILLVAYFGGLILQKIVTRFLDTLNVDSRFAELSGAKEGEGEAEEAPERPFSVAAGQVVFWLMMVFGLAGAIDALEIGPLAHAMRNVVDRVINLLPSVGIAVVIVVAGYMLGRIARSIIDNLLDSAGFNKLTEKLHLEKIFGEMKPSTVVGVAAMVFIILQAAIAGLNELELETLSVPLTDMMSQFWDLLPVLFVAALIIAAGVVAGRVLRRIVEKALQNMEFDKLMERLGFGELQNRSEHLKSPHQLVGLIVLIAAILIATVQALEKVALENWAGYLDSFLTYSVTHVAVALVIVTIGFAIGNYVRDLIDARRDSGNDESMRWIAQFARYAILVFAFTMAVHHLDVGPGFVLISFSLLFGGLCLALALAFGLGSREVAGEIVRKQYDKAKREFGAKGPLGGGGVKPAPVKPSAGGPIPGKPTPGKPVP